MHDHRKKKHHITSLFRSTMGLQKERGREVLHVVQSLKGTVEDQFGWDQSQYFQASYAHYNDFL